ncbi:EscU/YscU/HrcU family type III secretion system export apparatus switch protein [Anaeromyxobacter diazotrophicus]|uniref:Type III secretion exporter n=1 Tax=Anaeromyxobacter diazotrophicus TaxID=2590199 RepID=A0A7I9VHF8_9BACT|nr:EscU/YscU/HrcU family type III secretion system export apparatus switch protein [Anaeromyxobacter diazotrophicus]GEJ55578.1 hypothetical protein AMYX_03190 [Anaeromyxobacter diazotrophicus]
MSERTEQPTPRRLREARRRGEVASSRELTGAAALAAGLAALAVTGPGAARALAALLRRALLEAIGPAPSPAPAAALLRATAALAAAALPPCAAAGAGALLAGLVQTRGLFAPEALRFRPERLDVARGLARLASGGRLAALGLAAAKAAAALALAAGLVRAALPQALAAARLAPAQLLRLLPALALRVALPVLGLLVALGLLDLALARWRLHRSLRMTRAEVQRERREDEGDPRLVAERRRLARAGGAGPLRLATCLVVNPTHVAVALRHEPHRDDPPWVLAKGIGAAAARLRTEARRAGVPVVRDPALARALFRLAEVGDAIPEELYDAAAAVLVHVRAGAQEGG